MHDSATGAPTPAGNLICKASRKSAANPPARTTINRGIRVPLDAPPSTQLYLGQYPLPAYVGLEQSRESSVGYIYSTLDSCLWSGCARLPGCVPCHLGPLYTFPIRPPGSRRLSGPTPGVYHKRVYILSDARDVISVCTSWLYRGDRLRSSQGPAFHRMQNDVSPPPGVANAHTQGETERARLLLPAPCTRPSLGAPPRAPWRPIGHVGPAPMRRRRRGRGGGAGRGPAGGPGA